jgi:hypothetical protein
MLPRGEVHRCGHREAFDTRGGGSIVGGEHTWGVIQGLDHESELIRVPAANGIITKETVGSRARDGKAAELRGCGRIRKAPGLIVGHRATGLSVARRIRERIALGNLSRLGGESEPFKTYAARWLTDGEGSRKATTHRFYSF